MKKLIVIALVLILTLSLAACNDSKSITPSDENDITPSNVNSNVQSGENGNTKNSGSSPTPTIPSESNNKPPTQDNKPNYSLTNTVIVDDENLTFTITSIEESNIWGFTLKVFCDNKTDKDLMFSWDDVSVNGFMVDPYWVSSIQPGKRSYNEISFSSSSFEENAIIDVEEIEFKLRIYNSDDWSAPDVVNEIFTYTP